MMRLSDFRMTTDFLIFEIKNLRNFTYGIEFVSFQWAKKNFPGNWVIFEAKHVTEIPEIPCNAVTPSASKYPGPRFVPNRNSSIMKYSCRHVPHSVEQPLVDSIHIARHAIDDAPGRRRVEERHRRLQQAIDHATVDS